MQKQSRSRERKLLDTRSSVTEYSDNYVGSDGKRSRVIVRKVERVRSQGESSWIDAQLSLILYGLITFILAVITTVIELGWGLELIDSGTGSFPSFASMGEGARLIVQAGQLAEFAYYAFAEAIIAVGSLMIVYAIYHLVAKKLLGGAARYRTLMHLLTPLAAMISVVFYAMIIMTLFTTGSYAGDKIYYSETPLLVSILWLVVTPVAVFVTSRRVSQVYEFGLVKGFVTVVASLLGLGGAMIGFILLLTAIIVL